jgi:FKBP-type peptidyl-prolyl cis-trans isomerase FklB
MNKFILLAIASLLCMAQPAAAQKKKGKKSKGEKATVVAPQAVMTKMDSISYALGVSTAENLKKSGFQGVNYDLVMKGMKDQAAQNASITPANADAMVSGEMNRLANEKKEANKKDGEAFLEKNKTAPGVTTTASGLQYKILKKGTGGLKPDGNDKVTVHYHGTLIDGTVFDSSVDRGKTATFGLNQVIPGWTEGLQYMEVGDKFVFYIPQAIAYGSRAQGKILPFSTLIFEVELFNVEPVN